MQTPERTGYPFNGNKADKDGGAIYIINDIGENIIYSKFLNNEAGDDGRALERGNLHNYTLYIQ
ncbi:MAG: hypothetical protein IJT85_03055 [Ruminococcus sp.]|nr:hypothetical protein [Ruminococcus sp.]